MLNNYVGAFEITVDADTTTASGPQNYTVAIYYNNIGPLDTAMVTVNDTSVGPGNAEVIKLDPYDNYNTNTNTIVNQDDNTQVGTIAGTTWSTNIRQGGTVTLNSNDTALILPHKTVRTLTMWIKYLDRARDTTRYLIDSRYAGGNGGYLLRGDYSQWTQISVNGNNLVSVDEYTLSNLDAVANDWQFVAVVCDQDHTNQIALFNRFTMDEGAAPFQFGLIKAYNYAFTNADCLTAYQADLSRYAPPSAGLKQITLVDTMQIGQQPNASVAVLGVPTNQWDLIRNATQWWATPAGNSPYQMTYSGDNGSGDFTFTIGSNIINVGTSFWYSVTTSYTVRQFLYSYTSGNGASSIFVLDADYPNASTIPAGATATINGTPVSVTANVSSNAIYFNGGTGRQIDLSPNISVTSGTSITFSWTA